MRAPFAFIPAESGCLLFSLGEALLAGFFFKDGVVQVQFEFRRLLLQVRVLLQNFLFLRIILYCQDLVLLVLLIDLALFLEHPLPSLLLHTLRTHIQVLHLCVFVTEKFPSIQPHLIEGVAIWVIFELGVVSGKNLGVLRENFLH
mmetsp:Transcript_25367/g.24722  ORF Transcript_25367/g.24722 Transcript_25367/m.24722 type:complete len:145 (-) Transcript_25367:44-478(-)